MRLWIVVESWRCGKITKLVRALTELDARALAFPESREYVQVDPVTDASGSGVLWTREEDWDVD